jgi:sec-independent protein translocase protein TatA
MPAPAAFLAISTAHLLIVLVVILIFFGVGKLPEVGAALGKGIKAFKESQKPDALDVTPDTKKIADSGDEAERGKEPEKERDSA